MNGLFIAEDANKIFLVRGKVVSRADEGLRVSGELISLINKKTFGEETFLPHPKMDRTFDAVFAGSHLAWRYLVDKFGDARYFVDCAMEPLTAEHLLFQDFRLADFLNPGSEDPPPDGVSPSSQ